MSIDYNFNEKHLLITGCTSGIGQQCAWDLNKFNATLSVTGRSSEKFVKTKEKLKSGSYNAFIGDLTNSEFIDDLVKDVKPLDGLVLSAGIVDYTPVKLISKQRIRNVFDLNFEANVLLIQKLLLKKKINNSASIVIISSISNKLGIPGTALYAASKAAISAYAKVLSSELSSKKIRVNTVVPGVIKTELITNKGVISVEEFNKDENAYPLGYGTVEDVSNQIMYLLSDASKWVTGSEFVLDGGYLLK
ncbi:SDR family NAD(P)-dependent oxidoreductase [Mucilaginibacter jinjuensis]|uniref:SDR family NAD(P)-dependent oxidoreductase n=1 Tax=Mucilaginibacter jinjuensis TaxID=1176721 RepID=A0ABY7T9K4_9SPHI|nr:SDR family oxidoreductase [Mucilaginibacter jinjuensis]WCT13160.1 SDR family NAD(P)-dependent oxidoreductase [Mucilaginibacter jinjuensis]